VYGHFQRKCKLLVRVTGRGCQRPVILLLLAVVVVVGKLVAVVVQAGYLQI
jgi:hypothetical protein